jgi:toxin ParE1/3/4
MKLGISKSEYFLADFDLQFRWYEKKAGWEIARHYLEAVDQTIEKLAEQPNLGRPRNFAHPELTGLRSCLVGRPFHKHLVFYRFDNATLDVIRIMHGARDLPTRLRQSPGAKGDQTE